MMTIYTSSPETTKVSLLLLGIQGLGMPVVLRPLAELPTAPAAPQGRCRSLQAELAEYRRLLATAERSLRAIREGRLFAQPGQLQGLLSDEDALRSRIRAIERSLTKLQEGGQGNG